MCIYYISENCAPVLYDTASNDNLLPTYFWTTWHFKKGPIGVPETSVRNYHYLLRNNPAGRSSCLLREGSLKSRTKIFLVPPDCIYRDKIIYFIWCTAFVLYVYCVWRFGAYSSYFWFSYLILSISVTVFGSQPAVTLLLLVATPCFLIHSLMIADLKAKRVHTAEVYTATV